MVIDWNAFTPIASLASGGLIGLAAAMFVLLDGRIASISGIVGGLLTPVRGDLARHAAFLVGPLFATLLFATMLVVAGVAQARERNTTITGANGSAAQRSAA